MLPFSWEELQIIIIKIEQNCDNFILNCFLGLNSSSPSPPSFPDSQSKNVFLFLSVHFLKLIDLVKQFTISPPPLVLLSLLEVQQHILFIKIGLDLIQIKYIFST